MVGGAGKSKTSVVSNTGVHLCDYYFLGEEYVCEVVEGFEGEVVFVVVLASRFVVVVVGFEVEVDAFGAPFEGDYFDAFGGDVGSEVKLDEGAVGLGVGGEEDGGSVLGPGAHVVAIKEVEGLEI